MRQAVPREAEPVVTDIPSPSIAAASGARPSRPRLLILTVGFAPGGAGTIVLATAPRLQRAGFEVTVACLKGWGELGDDLEGRGVRAMALGANGRPDLKVVGRLLSILRRDRIQILHSHLFPANLAARIVGKVAGVPVVITSLHDSDLGMGIRERLAERLTAPLSDAVIACSEAMRRHAIETHGLRPGLVLTLRNGIEVTAPPPDAAARNRLRRDLGAGPEDPLIGTVGGLDGRTRGLVVFLAAARLLAAEFPRARFAIVGDGPARDSLEGGAAREGISHRTAFTGARRDVPAVMGALDLFAQPSLWEGCGVTILEAMAAGTPVVAGRLGGVPEMVQDGATGILVTPGDPRDLARGCAALLRDRDLSARLARSGRARVEASFRVEELVERTAAMYRDLLSRRRGGPGRQPAP